MADSITNHVLSIETPHVHNIMDLDPEVGVTSRQELIKLLLESQMQSFSPHFPWPNVGQVVKTEAGATWKPAE